MFQIYEFDFVKREFLFEVLEPIKELDDARQIAELHAHEWAGHEGVECFSLTLAPTKSGRPKYPDLIAYCSPESDFGTVIKRL